MECRPLKIEKNTFEYFNAVLIDDQNKCFLQNLLTITFLEQLIKLPQVPQEADIRVAAEEVVAGDQHVTRVPDDVDHAAGVQQARGEEGGRQVGLQVSRGAQAFEV